MIYLQIIQQGLLQEIMMRFAETNDDIWTFLLYIAKYSLQAYIGNSLSFLYT